MLNLKLKTICRYCMLLLSAGTVYRLPASQIERPVTIFAPPARAREIADLTEFVYQNVDYFFGPGPLTRPLPIHVHVNRPPATERDYNHALPLFLPAGEDDRQLVAAITRKVLQQRIRQFRESEPNPTGEPSETGDYEWLVAALTFGIRQGYPEGTVQLRPNYQPADMIFRQGHFPDLNILLNRPATIEEPLLFDLYSMHCHILLSLIRGPAPRIWRRAAPPATPARELLLAAAKGMPPTAALEHTLTVLDPQTTSVQEWYQRNAPARARQSRRILDSRRVVEELFSILTINPAREGKIPTDTELTEEHETGIQSLAEYDNDEFWDQNKNLIADRQNRLLWLYPRASTILQPAISTYLEAMSELYNAGHTSRFLRLLGQGDREMSSSLDQQRKIAAKLDEIETASPSSPEPSPDALAVIVEQQRRKREMIPEISRLLDEIE